MIITHPRMIDACERALRRAGYSSVTLGHATPPFVKVTAQKPTRARQGEDDLRPVVCAIGRTPEEAYRKVCWLAGVQVRDA